MVEKEEDNYVYGGIFLSQCSITFLPTGIRAEAGEDITIAMAAQQAGLYLDQPCGGKGACGKCQVRIVQSDGSEEDVLACRTTVEDSLTVQLQDKPYIVDVDFQLEVRPLKGPSMIQKLFVKPSTATLNRPASDMDRLFNTLSDKIDDCVAAFSIKEELTSEVPGLLHQNEGLTTVLHGTEIIGVFRGEEQSRCYGMAVDLGTTTLAGYLVDLVSGKLLVALTVLNPQTDAGADVISRIEVSGDAAKFARLHTSLCKAVDGLVAAACAQAGVCRNEVFEIVVAGNTTMQHFFCGISPYYLGQSPFLPAVDHALNLNPVRLGLEIYPLARVFVFPALTGFVGGDTIAAVLACGQHLRKGITLLVDIGTNGEIVLGGKDGLLACSAAAGPAFEGARVYCGMRGIPGAISKVEIGVDGLTIQTIGEQPAKGICGTGLIDAVATLLENGLLDSKGRFVPNSLAESDEKAPLAGLVSGEGLERKLTLVTASESATGSAITLSQQDISELQLAKAAIRASIELLCKEMGVTVTMIEEVYLAGAFGSFINPYNAVSIGLLPNMPGVPITALGNAAGEGCRRALLSVSEREQTQQIKEMTTCLELATRPDFQSEFVNALLFPVPKGR